MHLRLGSVSVGKRVPYHFLSSHILRFYKKHVCNFGHWNKTILKNCKFSRNFQVSRKISYTPNQNEASNITVADLCLNPWVTSFIIFVIIPYDHNLKILLSINSVFFTNLSSVSNMQHLIKHVLSKSLRTSKTQLGLLRTSEMESSSTIVNDF